MYTLREIWTRFDLRVKTTWAEITAVSKVKHKGVWSGETRPNDSRFCLCPSSVV